MISEFCNEFDTNFCIPHLHPLHAACAGPLPSAESMVPNRAYLPDTEEQTTTWTSPNVDGGPFMEANKTITEIILNIDQNTGLRHTRQAIEPAELPGLA